MGFPLRCASVVAAVATLAAPSASAQAFGGFQIYAGAGPVEVSVGDLNNDGKKDFVVVNFEATAAILLGTNYPGFGSPQFHSYGGTGSDPSSLALGDFTGDGKTDMALGLGLGVLKLIPLNGMGGFNPEISVNTVTNPKTPHLVDLTGDGKLDVVFARFGGGSGQVGACANNGAGGFGALQSFSAPGSSRAIAVGDLNADGRADVVVASDTTFLGVSVLLGMPPVHGSLVLAPHVDFPVAGGPQGLALGDFDKDGKLDVVTANFVGKTMALLLGDGLGGFGAPALTPLTFNPMAVDTGDVNGDTNPDATVLENGGHVDVLLGMGTGAFFPAKTYNVMSAQAVHPEDLDGDGRDEVLVAFHGSGPSGIGIFGTDTAGTVSFPEIYGVPQGGSSDVAIGDVDGDGRPDLMTVDNGGFPPFLTGNLRVFLGTPAGTFAPPYLAGSAPYFRVCLADLTHDGNLDAVVAQFSTSKLDVYLGNGIGGFALVTSVTTAATSPFDVNVADLDADSNPDVVTADASADVLTIFFGNGSGGFLGSSTLATGNFPLEAHATDLNNDGILDLVSADNTAGISVFLGFGGGSFSPAAHYISTTSTNGLHPDDLNGDGNVDVAVASASDPAYVFFGNGSGTLAGPVVLSLPNLTLPRGITTGDVDGDGRRDVVTANLGTGSIAVFRGAGGGGFAPPDMYSAGGAGESVQLADVDIDGRPDAIVDIGNNIGVLRGVLATPVGTAQYGLGTAGCGGFLGFTANSIPKVGSTTYAYIATNAPRRALGLGIVTDLQDFAGSDPFTLGVTLHIGIFGANQLIAMDAKSDSSGIGFAPAPIPNSPFLVGSNFFVQTLWVESASSGQACSSSPFHLVTSGAVGVTVQP